MKILLLFIGCFLIWTAVYLNRHGESKINFLDKNWWILLLLVTVGCILISIYGSFAY